MAAAIAAAAGRARARRRRLLLVVAVLVAVLAAAPVAGLAPQEQAFIGWEGESYKPAEPGQQHHQQQPQQQHNSSSTSGGDGRRKWIETVSWKPRAFVFHAFLSDAEAEHIKLLAAPMMKRSTVVSANGSSVLDDYRTSYGTFIKRKADAVVEAIEERIAQWARIPQVNAEDMQVLRYGLGQQYKPHMDSLRDEESGPRVCTVLLYLNDVPRGGETAFPYSNRWVHASLPARLGPFSPCAAGSVAFKPKKGDALMFWSIHPDGQREDSFSMHTGCPVLSGVKWTATKWIHPRPFRPATFGDLQPYDRIDPGLCQDADKACPAWATQGECTRNPQFMLGDMGSPGRCVLSCGQCRRCRKGDRGCYNENRRRAGFLVYAKDDLDSDAPAAGGNA